MCVRQLLLKKFALIPIPTSYIKYSPPVNRRLNIALLAVLLVGNGCLSSAIFYVSILKLFSIFAVFCSPLDDLPNFAII
jgi:hypothetical protein